MNLAVHLAFVMVIPKSAPETKAMAEVVILENASVHTHSLITKFAMLMHEILI